MIGTAPLPVSPEELEAFRRDGYIVREDVVDPERREAALARARELLGGGTDEAVITRFSNAETPVLQKIPGLALSDQVFGALARDTAIVDVVEGLLDESALIFRDVLVVKPAREGAALEWHQDSAYWDIDPPALVSAWVALADVSLEAGCLTVIPGSHSHTIEHDVQLGGGRRLPRPLTRLLRRAVSLAGTGDNAKGAGGSPALDALKRLVLGSATRVLPFLGKLGDYGIAEDEIAKVDGQRVDLTVPAGSVVFFHSLLLHASRPNTTDRDRIAPIISYMGKSFRFTGRGEPQFVPAREQR